VDGLNGVPPLHRRAIFIGPAVGFKTGCTVSGTESGVEVSFDCDDPNMDVDLKSVDLGAMAGVGVDVGLTEKVSLIIDGFYNLGLTKVDNSGVDDDVKHRAFSILAGLSFAVGG